MNGRSDPSGALILGIGVGLYLFYKGFRNFREYKVLADTPRMPIRSLSMGFTHIGGQAEGASLLSSPLTRTPCCLYRVEIDQWKTRDRSASWERICTDADGLQFYVADKTGRVLVDGHAAEFDLQPTQERVVSSANPAAAGDDVQLLNYVTCAQTHHLTDTVSQYLGHRLDQKLERGSLDPAKQQAAEALQQFLHALPDVQQTGQLPFGALAKVLASTGPLADPEKEARRQQALSRFQTMQAMPLQQEILAQLHPHAAEGRFRLREYVIRPGEECFVSGTCTENPQPSGEGDRNLIRKGETEPTFLISCQPERKAASAVRGRSLKMVLGGAALTVVCLALLLAHWNMF
ncbi:MAG TPA: hypothetical protein VLT90_11550 [Terriglobales bacterium]|nr:hypothetical protein [Terriglobales bacterium]